MARQIAMYLCRELTDLSLPKIGAQFGNRDHTTVMYADRKINQLLAERRAVFNQVSELTNRIKLQARQALSRRDGRRSRCGRHAVRWSELHGEDLWTHAAAAPPARSPSTRRARVVRASSTPPVHRELRR